MDAGSGRGVKKRGTSEAGEHLLDAAEERIRAEATMTVDPVMGTISRKEARRLSAKATRPLALDDCTALGVPAGQVVQDGELTLRLTDTSYAPSSLAAYAHKERLRLAEDAGCLDLAMDASVTVRPENSLERMLAHQLAAAHASAMRLMASADGWLREAETSAGFASQAGTHRAQIASVEAARLTSAAARMMSTFQDGMATLAKLRTGGRQTVTVQHVHVSEGGQAVIAGRMTPGKTRQRR